MTSSCKCWRAGLPRANNEVGMEIQEYQPHTGWVAPDHYKFQNCCQAKRVFDRLPEDGIERRLYPTLV